MFSIGKTIKLISAAEAAATPPELMLENCRNNDVPCYVMTDISVRRYSYKGYADEEFFFLEGEQRYVIKENFRVREFYKLSQTEVNEILYGKTHTTTIQSFRVMNFPQDKLPTILIESIDDATNIAADELQSYGISDLVLADLESEKDTREYDDSNCVDISDFPEILKIAIRMYQICWPLRDEKEDRPFEDNFTKHLKNNLNFTNQMAEDLWNIIHPKNDNNRRDPDKDVFDFTKLDEFKQLSTK